MFSLALKAFDENKHLGFRLYSEVQNAHVPLNGTSGDPCLPSNKQIHKYEKIWSVATENI